MILDYEVVLSLNENPRMSVFNESLRVVEEFAVDLKGSINWTMLYLNGKYWALMSIRFLQYFLDFIMTLKYIVFSCKIFSPLFLKSRKRKISVHEETVVIYA